MNSIINKKIISITLIVLFFVISLFCGCAKEVYFSLCTDSGEVCTVVYAEYEDELYKDYVRSISSLLSKISGSEVSYIPISEYKNQGETLVLIGDTGLNGSKVFLKSLKYSDYGFGLGDNALCVTGHTLKNTNKALSDFEAFLANIKNGDKQYVSIDTNGSVKLSAKGFNITNEEYCDLKVDGIPINEFSIICNEKDRKYAEDLRVYLGEKTGAVLNIFDASKKENKNEILIGDVGREITDKYFKSDNKAFSKYKVEISDGKIAFLQKNSATLAANYEAFLEKLDKVTQNKEKLKIGEQDFCVGEIESNIKDRAKSTDVRIASNNIYFWERMGLPINERCFLLYNSFELFDADVLLLQEVSSYWHETMDETMIKMGYTLVPTDDSLVVGVTEKDNYTPIWYREDKLKLIDYGYNQYSSVAYRPDGDLSTSKSYTWAVFEEKNGKKFACLSTHFTWAPNHFIPSPTELKISDATEAVAALMAIELEYPDIPVFLMGDLNCSSTSEPYNILKSQFFDVRGNAESNHNTNYGSYHNIGVSPARGGSIIDHTFTNNKNVKLLQYQFVINEWSLNSTDHIPFLLDIRLN